MIVKEVPSLKLGMTEPTLLYQIRFRNGLWEPDETRNSIDFNRKERVTRGEAACAARATATNIQ